MNHLTENMALCKGYLSMLAIIFIIACLFSSTTYGGNKMEPLYNLSEARSLKPEVYKIGTDSLLSLFSVPQDNSIGTNDLNNAITILSFKKGKIKKDQYFKNAFDQVGGGGRFIPVIASDTIGFGQVRRFVTYNFRTKIHQRYRIVVSLDETIQKIAITDAQQRNFIFEIKEYNSKSEDHRDYTNNLLLMDLSNKEPRLIKELNIGKVTVWTSALDKIFLYDLKKEQMNVITTSFEPSHHPFVDIIKHNKGKVRFTRIHLHPFHPFAILSGGKYGAMFVNWGDGRDTTPHHLLEDAQQFSFSPDGKWVVFQKDFPEPKKTYLMPVSEKYPHYLGSPILLLNNYFDPNNCGWTTNPISFVASDGEIYRWELTKEAYPESDKATFHDYIVEHDLAKLTKEKKQGLGK
jgi:hypothetical protein